MLSVPIVVKNGAKIPSYALADSSGVDLPAFLNEPKILGVGQRALIPTGLSMAIPEGYEAQIRPRSGLALNHGITVLNAPGTIDAGYRGEIQVLLINLSDQPFTIEPGMRIAQCVFAPITLVRFDSVAVLNASERHEGGFGSSGIH